MLHAGGAGGGREGGDSAFSALVPLAFTSCQHHVCSARSLVFVFLLMEALSHLRSVKETSQVCVVVFLGGRCEAIGPPFL